MADARISDEVMGDFFVAAQALLNEGKITVEAVARLRNALYGPAVRPIDWTRYDDAHRWREPPP